MTKEEAEALITLAHNEGITEEQLAKWFMGALIDKVAKALTDYKEKEKMIRLLKVFGIRKTLKILYIKHILKQCRHSCDTCQYWNECFDNFYWEV